MAVSSRKSPFAPALCFLLCLFSPLGAEPSGPGELDIRDILPLTPDERGQLAIILSSSPDARMLLARKELEAKAWEKNQPSPIPVIHYEGLLNTDPLRIETVKHLRDLDQCAAWFEIWQANGDALASERCRKFILSWSRTYVPGGNDVNEYKLLALLVAYESLRPAFGHTEQIQVDAWVRKMAELHRNAIKDSNKATGNRYAKRLRLLATAGLILNEPAWIQEATSACRTLITHALYPDGRSHDFVQRDTLTYHTTTLRPLLDLAFLAKRQNIDLYTWESPTGGSLKKSTNFIRPYVNGENEHKEWVNSKADIDKKRAQAGIRHYQPGEPYDPRHALPLLSEAELFDSSLNPLVRQLSGLSPSDFPVWRLVLNEAIRKAAKSPPGPTSGPGTLE